MTDLYFNNAFSKQPLAEAVNAMTPYLHHEYENPLTESEGAEKAREILGTARKNIGVLLQCADDEIYFVSSGTEANNWAVKGAAFTHQKTKNHIILSQIEHFSVYQSVQFLQRQGFDATFVPVSPEGFVDVDFIAESIRPETVLVTIQAASDEIGVIQNLAAIASLKERFDDVLFHSDAIQYLCYEDLSTGRIPLDLISISSNAIYGPQGIAALYVRSGTRLTPLLHGGMQEGGLRPGLQSIALTAGFGEAARINALRKREWKEKLTGLQERIFRAMDSQSLSVTGSRSCRLVDNIHITSDVDGEALLTLLLTDGIRASSGSTCYQYAQKESHVLKALGRTQEEARGSLLFTLGKNHDAESVDILLGSIGRTVDHLRNVKP